MKSLYYIIVIMIIAAGGLGYHVGGNIAKRDLTDEYYGGWDAGEESARAKAGLLFYRFAISAGGIYDVALGSEIKVSYITRDAQSPHSAIDSHPLVDEVTYTWYVNDDGGAMLRIFNQTHSDILAGLGAEYFIANDWFMGEFD